MAISLYDAYDKKVQTAHTVCRPGLFLAYHQDNLWPVMEMIRFIKMFTEHRQKYS